MLGLDEYAQSRFYIEYSIYTHLLFLWIKGCQFFRNCVCDETHNESFGLGLTAINKVPKGIVYMYYDIIVLFDQCLNDVVYDVKLPCPGKFLYSWFFPYPENFPYPRFLHEFLHVFILGLPYPGNFPYRVIFLYPVKYSIRKSDKHR